MDLPAERRINIHIKIFDGLPEAYLSTRTRKHLACRSALPRVSCHFRNDFIPILCLYSHEIVSSVRDFNFGPVITFFNHLHDYEVKALLSVGTPSEQKMTVALKLVDNRTAYETPYRITSLIRWLNRLQNPQRRGASIETAYRVVESSVRNRGSWCERLEVQVGKVDGRERAELAKNIAAFKQPGAL